MIAAVRGWLTSLIYTAMVVAVAEHIVPSGGLKKIVSLTGGFLLLMMMVKPLERVDLDFMTFDYDGYAQTVEERREELEQEQTQKLRMLIEEQTAAYISDKARRLGLECRVTVRCKVGEEGVPYPDSVVVDGVGSEELGKWMAEELDIPTERQVFHGVEG